MTGCKTEWFPPSGWRAPDARTVDKAHGRKEIRELWLVPAGDLEPYLAQEWGWPQVRQVGWLRRQQQRRPGGRWSDETVTLVASLDPHAAAPSSILVYQRRHWTIENRVHWVRDVVQGEDRGHARKISRVLATIRNTAISLFRAHGRPDIAAAQRFASANRETVIRWLTRRLMN